ncbi:MAG: purine-nucleoside phosphorylase [Ruminococcaceae bacterium]|nr:purine-nucleoside phosphorylase [Oscillospiraceae bacterium]
MSIYAKLEKCLECVRKQTDFVPDVAVILGSGLGALADEIKKEAVVEYSSIEGFPVSTVPGHKGRFVFGYMGDVKVVVMQGRVHFYEGYPITDVVLPTRLMKLMGAKILFVTNAAGGANPEFDAGDLMLINDHICKVPNPLIGANVEELGTRFPDMSEVYSSRLRNVVRKVASENGVDLKEGVYVQLTGPSFETPAEVRMCRFFGGDAVGMSTACEAIAARHAGMEIVGVSLISNKAAGISETPLTHEEVQEAANLAAPKFKKLVTDSVSRFGEFLK